MTGKLAVSLSLVLAFLGGCATHHGLLMPDVDKDTAGIVQTGRTQRGGNPWENEIADLLDRDAEVAFPATVALAPLRSCWDSNSFELHAADSEELANWTKLADEQTHIKGFRAVSALTVPGSTVRMQSLRKAAARLKCELLLVYLRGDGAVDNFNDAAALYWTLIGIWLVPGNSMEHKTVMHAVLVHTRTGTILGAASGDAHLTRITALAYKGITEARLAKRAPIEALADLQTDCAKMFKGMPVPDTSAAPAVEPTNEKDG